MERIKNLNEVILRPDTLLTEIVEIKSSNIILPGAEESRDSLDYMRVIAVGIKVDDIGVGDYLLDMIPTEIGMYVIGDKKYGIVFRNNIRIAVKADNFNDKNIDNNKLSV